VVSWACCTIPRLHRDCTSVVSPAKPWPPSSVMPTCVVGDGGPGAVADGERHNTKSR
jgi:hypothetical protein